MAPTHANHRAALPVTTRALLVCGAIGGPLFIVVFLIEGATRAGYNAFRHPVSSLAIGSGGWVQAVNFLVAGCALLALAASARRVLRGSRGGTWGPLLIGLAGIGLVGAGICTTDPIYGYPPDRPLLLAQYTVRGHLHDLFSVLVFAGLPAACFVLCRRFYAAGERAQAVYALVSGVGMLVCFVLAAVGFAQQAPLVAVAGVFQRLSIAVGLVWTALFAVRLTHVIAR